MTQLFANTSPTVIEPGIASTHARRHRPDVLDVPDYQTCGCNDYFLCEVPAEGESSKSYVVLNPRTMIVVKPRDRKDHITWLVERKRYEEALEQVELLEGQELNVVEIGEKYIDHLIVEGSCK